MSEYASYCEKPPSLNEHVVINRYFKTANLNEVNVIKPAIFLTDTVKPVILRNHSKRI
jgi:hypothetical protein